MGNPSSDERSKRDAVMAGESELADLTARFEQAAAQLTAQEVAGQGIAQQLLDIAAQLGVQPFFGTITIMGRMSSGKSAVTFLDSSSNLSWGSEWPQWAYELARDALLGGKRVLVVSNGDPSGPNLIAVLLLAY
jgi:hypothetical protein